MNPTKKQPLFIITGASGVGKSTMSEVLFQNEIDYIVMESDLLWDEVYNTPEDDYKAYRELWLVALCGLQFQSSLRDVMHAFCLYLLYCTGL